MIRPVKPCSVSEIARLNKPDYFEGQQRNIGSWSASIRDCQREEKIEKNTKGERAVTPKAQTRHWPVFLVIAMTMSAPETLKWPSRRPPTPRGQRFSSKRYRSGDAIEWWLNWNAIESRSLGRLSRTTVIRSVRCRWLWHMCCSPTGCRAGEGSSLIHIKSKSDNVKFPEIGGFLLPYIRAFFSLLNFILALVLLHICISHIQCTEEYGVQCYWLQIGNMPSSPRDCTWHCNTSWTGAEELFPTGQPLLHCYLFWFIFE